MKDLGLALWLAPLTPALRRRGQEELEFKAILVSVTLGLVTSSAVPWSLKILTADLRHFTFAFFLCRKRGDVPV